MNIVFHAISNIEAHLRQIQGIVHAIPSVLDCSSLIAFSEKLVNLEPEIISSYTYQVSGSLQGVSFLLMFIWRESKLNARIKDGRKAQSFKVFGTFSKSLFLPLSLY